MTKSLWKSPPSDASAGNSSHVMELVCPVDSLVTLRTAIDHGADCVRLVGCNVRRMNGFAGLHSHHAAIAKGIRYAHDRQRTIVLDVDANMAGATWEYRRTLVDDAALSGIDAVRITDPALMLYSAAKYPDLHIHYAVPDSPLSVDTLNSIQRHFGVSRIVLPNVISLAQLEQFSSGTSVDLEVVGFGRRCTIVEKRARSSPASQNTRHSTRTIETGITGETANLYESAISGCAGDGAAVNDSLYIVDRQPDASALRLLPWLTSAGIRAIQVNAQYLGPLPLAQLMKIWREAIDDCLDSFDHYAVKPAWVNELNKLTKPIAPT